MSKIKNLKVGKKYKYNSQILNEILTIIGVNNYYLNATDQGSVIYYIPANYYCNFSNINSYFQEKNYV